MKEHLIALRQIGWWKLDATISPNGRVAVIAQHMTETQPCMGGGEAPAMLVSEYADTLEEAVTDIYEQAVAR